MKRFIYLIVILLLSVNGFAQGHFTVAFDGLGQDHMTIYVVTATNAGIPLKAGDEIAVFDGSICCGKAVLKQSVALSNKSTFALIPASKEDDGQSNGYVAGHAISFKFWDSGQNKEVSGITAEFINPATGLPISEPAFAANTTVFVKLSIAGPVNQVPVSHAGSDQTVNEGATVSLDGSTSADPDGNSLTYKWTAPAGISLSSTTDAKPTFTAPDVTINTSYTLSLIVNDGVADSPADQVVITVKNVINEIPVANAGSDQIVNQGATVLLDGTASTDPEGSPLIYKWTAPAGISLSSTTDSKPTFTAPSVSINTSYTLSLVVNDGVSDSPADQVVITVRNVNNAPVSHAGPDQIVNEGATVSLDGSTSSDPDGNPLTYKWTAPAGISLSSTTDAKPTFTAPDVTINTSYTLSLIVNDGVADSPADQVVITVKNVINEIPLANAGSDQVVNQGAIVLLDGTASTDPEGSPLTYKWTAPAGISLSSTIESKPTFTAPTVSINTSYTLSLVVNDGVADSPADQVVITVRNINNAPVAHAGPDQIVNEGATVSLDGSTSSDPDGNPLTYKWTAPAGISLSSTTDAKPTFTAPEVTINTSYTLSLIVNDGVADSPTDQVVITVENVINRIPAANAGPDQSVNEGVTATLDGSASSDPDGDALTYKWTAPAGITLSSATDQKPTFIAPQVITNTDFKFSLVVNDGLADSPMDEVVVTVLQVNKAPIANAGPDQIVKEGSNVSLDGSASSDPDGDALIYKWTAPPGIILSSDTDEKPTFTAPKVSANTQYTFSLAVNDGNAESLADFVVIAVIQTDREPTANAGPDQSVNEGDLVTLDGSASSDSDNCPIDYKWTCPVELSLSKTYITRITFTGHEVIPTTDHTITLMFEDNSNPSDPSNSNKFQWVIPAGATLSSKIISKVTIITPSDLSEKKCTFSLEVFDGTSSSEPATGVIKYVSIPPTEIPLSSTTVITMSVTSPEPMPPVDYSFSMLVYDGSGSKTPGNGALVYLSIPPIAIKLSSPVISRLYITAPDGPTDPNYDFWLTICDSPELPDPNTGALTYRWIAPPEIILSSDTHAKPTFTAPEVSADTDYTLSLVVNNGKADSPPDQVVIRVKQINKAPTADPGNDQLVNEGAMVSLNGTSSFDPDGDALIYKWTTPAGFILSSETDAQPTFTAPDVITDTQFKFLLAVNDGHAVSPAEEVVITVLQVNKLPTADAGADQTVDEGVTVSLNGSDSSDPEGDAITYVWDAPPGITLSSENTVNPSFMAPQVSGDTQYTISLKVNDGQSESPTKEVVITVRNVDHSPYIKTIITDVSVDKGSPDQIFDLETVFADDDFGDVLIYSVISNTSDQVVEATISGSNLTLDFSSVNVGTSEIVITASSNGREVSSEFKVEVNIPTQIDLLSVDANVKIYPNPTKGLIKIEFSQKPKVGTMITIYSISGKMIGNLEVAGKNEFINLSELPRGIYFIKIDQKNPKTYKVVME
jgi:hypothetical protein